MRKVLNNFLLISGSGRNIGKTTLACKIISELSCKHNVVGLKISPHFHYDTNKQDIVIQEKNYSIYKEKSFNSGKDSSRMLDAGASKVYFIESDDIGVGEAIKKVLGLLENEIPVVCESGSFLNIYKPGMHIFVDNGTGEKVKTSPDPQKVNYNFIIQSEDILSGTFNVKTNYHNNIWSLSLIE